MFFSYQGWDILIVEVFAPTLGQLLMDVHYLVNSQMTEMELVRAKLYNLEQTQITIKQR